MRKGFVSPLILLQCDYRKVLARLKILLLLFGAWPTGHLLSGTSKQVTEQQEKSPPSWKNTLPLRLSLLREAQWQAAVVGIRAYGWTGCGPDSTQVPLMSQQLLPPLPHCPCPSAPARPAVSRTICSWGSPGSSDPFLR